MNLWKSTARLALPALLLAASACTLQKKGDGQEYQEAIPEAETVSVDGPGTTGGDSSSQSVSGANMSQSELQASGAGGATDYAVWYAFTREVRDGVNAVTAVVLGSVWHVVHTDPTDVAEDTAIWGPYTDALEPVTWRFRVTRVAPHEYDYVLEGRPKTSTDDADYEAVLTGKGYGKASEKHGDGYFLVDLDVAKRLDPLKHQDDSGTVKITHDLPRTITKELGALPRLITAELRPAGEQWVTIKSTAREDFTGELDIDAYVDVSETKDTAPEDVTILSRWQADGAGRADVTMANGDIPASVGSVDAVECWGPDFTRVYYSDNRNFSPTEGDEGACAY